MFTHHARHGRENPSPAAFRDRVGYDTTQEGDLVAEPVRFRREAVLLDATGDEHSDDQRGENDQHHVAGVELPEEFPGKGSQ